MVDTSWNTIHVSIGGMMHSFKIVVFIILAQISFLYSQKEPVFHLISEGDIAKMWADTQDSTILEVGREFIQAIIDQDVDKFLTFLPENERIDHGLDEITYFYKKDIAEVLRSWESDPLSPLAPPFNIVVYELWATDLWYDLSRKAGIDMPKIDSVRDILLQNDNIYLLVRQFYDANPSIFTPITEVELFVCVSSNTSSPYRAVMPFHKPLQLKKFGKDWKVVSLFWAIF